MNQILTNEELWYGIKLLIDIDKNQKDAFEYINDYDEYEKFLIEKYGQSVKEEIFLAYAKTHETKTTTQQIENKTMAGINFDATQVAPNAGFSAVEKGKYVVALTQTEFKPTSNGSGKILELHARINGGANHGRDVMFNLNWENSSAKAVEIGRGRFSAICHAVNVLHVQDTQQLHNIPFVLEVDVTPDGKYNEVLGIYPIGQGVQNEQPVSPTQIPQQQQFVQPNIAPAGPYAGYVQPQGQPAPVQQQPQYQAPQGQANPMAEYQAMGQPNPNMQPQGYVQQTVPPQQFAPQPLQQQQAPQDNVPDWIRNQQQAAQGQPGNV